MLWIISQIKIKFMIVSSRIFIVCMVMLFASQFYVSLFLTVAMAADPTQSIAVKKVKPVKKTVKKTNAAQKKTQNKAGTKKKKQPSFLGKMVKSATKTAVSAATMMSNPYGMGGMYGGMGYNEMYGGEMYGGMYGGMGYENPYIDPYGQYAQMNSGCYDPYNAYAQQNMYGNNPYNGSYDYNQQNYGYDQYNQQHYPQVYEQMGMGTYGGY